MQEDVVSVFKETVAKLDATAPDIKKIDHSIYDMILNNTDFTKSNTTQEVMDKFYEQLWMHVVFPLQDDNHAKDREIGRLIVEWHTEKKQKEAIQKELDTLREDLQGKGEA